MSENDYERAAEYVGVIRQMIQHEDDLLNHRLTWMWTLEGLLFSAAGFVWKESLAPLIAIAIVGLLSCISIGYSLNRGLCAVRDLFGMAGTFKDDLPKTFKLPPTIGSRRRAIEWLLPGRFLPWLFGMAWIGLVGLRLANL